MLISLNSISFRLCCYLPVNSFGVKGGANVLLRGEDRLTALDMAKGRNRCKKKHTYTQQAKVHVLWETLADTELREMSLHRE